MKLKDIIDFKNSYWNVLGKTGGKSVPSNKKSKNINGVEVWNKSKKRKINEVQRGPDYDWDDPRYKKGPSKVEHPYGGWAKSPKGGDSITVHRKGVPTRKVIVYRVGDNSIESIDDEGNHRLHDIKGNAKTGPIIYKRMHTGYPSRSLGSDVKEGHLAGTQAGERPAPGPSELEYDLDWKNLKKEFKGKNSRADIKTSKYKRMKLKTYLANRKIGNI